MIYDRSIPRVVIVTDCPFNRYHAGRYVGRIFTNWNCPGWVQVRELGAVRV